MNIIVTGGAGFIGSNLTDKLISIGHNVTVIDNESSISSSKFYWNSAANNYNLDILDYENTKDLYNGIDIVFHMAADSRVQTGIDNPLYSVKNNSLGTATVLECSRQAGVKRVIYSSTSAIYGNNTIPNIETQADQCLNPYSVSKLSGEKLCSMYTHLYGLETIIFRYFNVYGNRQPKDGTYASVVGIFLDQFEKGRDLTITGDGSQKRDFINVEDIVSANILASSANLNKNIFGSIFNVGYGKSYSINDIAKTISDKVSYIPKKPGESIETLADIEKIKHVLGWKPSISIEKWIKEYLTNSTKY